VGVCNGSRRRFERRFRRCFSSRLSGDPGETYNWSGLYVGAHGGYGWADTDYPGQPQYPAGPPRPELEGGLVGGQIGYNLQFTNVVVGIEADYSFTKMSETTRDGNYLTQDHEISGLGSVRGRLGYAFGHVLPFVTAGWAWNQASFNQTCPDPAAVPFGHCNPANGFAPYDITKDQTETGWVYGGGVETLIASNWSLRAEYLRYDFDEQSYNLGLTPSGKDLGSKTLEHDVDVVRFGVNYKFGGRDKPAPLK
jgi:outer membrane immunogenic protein